MVPSSFNSYSDLLDLFISRERKCCPKIKDEDLITRKIGISMKMYDRLKREYMPNFKSNTSNILRRYFETWFQHTFIHYKGKILTRELPSGPTSVREKRMEKRINNLVTHVKVLEIENNYLRNRIKKFKDTGISV